MASRNSIKVYLEDSFYHLYNRGVEKRNIFLDDQDYAVFLSYLQTYLLPKDEKTLRATLISQTSSRHEKDQSLKLLNLKNYSGDIELLCYALLPNHFHLLIKQNCPVLPSFMNSLGTRYAMYFNRKYHRTGVLFQDVYKAVFVESDEQLLHLSRYIHLNPTEALGLPPLKWQEAKSPTSLPEHIGIKNTPWIQKHYILDYFSKTNPKDSYENFLGMDYDLSFVTMSGIDIED